MERIQLKADPYAFRSQLRPDTASVVHWLPPLIASDKKQQKMPMLLDAPVSIYEVHLGSWRLPQDGRRWLSYRELAEQLIPYVRSLAFTHIDSCR